MAKAKTILLSELIDSYKQSLGDAGAEKLVTEAIKKTSLQERNEYTKEEALLICQELKKSPGFVSIIAGILMSRIMLR